MKFGGDNLKKGSLNSRIDITGSTEVIERINAFLNGKNRSKWLLDLAIREIEQCDQYHDIKTKRKLYVEEKIKPELEKILKKYQYHAISDLMKSPSEMESLSKKLDGLDINVDKKELNLMLGGILNDRAGK